MEFIGVSVLCRKVYPAVPRYVLWIMMEVAIIGSDIQEVLHLLPLSHNAPSTPPMGFRSTTSHSVYLGWACKHPHPAWLKPDKLIPMMPAV